MNILKVNNEKEYNRVKKTGHKFLKISIFLYYMYSAFFILINAIPLSGPNRFGSSNLKFYCSCLVLSSISVYIAKHLKKVELKSKIYIHLPIFLLIGTLLYPVGLL